MDSIAKLAIDYQKLLGSYYNVIYRWGIEERRSWSQNKEYRKKRSKKTFRNESRWFNA